MSSDELTPETDVVTLVTVTDGLGVGTAQRLEDRGIETVADVHDAAEATLTSVAYVSHRRAETLQQTAAEVVSPEPRDVDFEATESAVTESALPLSVRRGDAVLTAAGQGGATTYHTTDCPVVRGSSLRERDWEWVSSRDHVEQCRLCRKDPSARGQRTDTNSDIASVSDSRDVVLEASVGEKLQITLADRSGYDKPRFVIEAPDPITWTSDVGDTWQIRRLRMSDSASGQDHGREFDLIAIGDELRIRDPPADSPARSSWPVQAVDAVGRASLNARVQLQGKREGDDTPPDGDDSWKQYQNPGETA